MSFRWLWRIAASSPGRMPANQHRATASSPASQHGISSGGRVAASPVTSSTATRQPGPQITCVRYRTRARAARLAYRPTMAPHLAPDGALLAVLAEG
jgi:hypothetical protein